MLNKFEIVAYTIIKSFLILFTMVMMVASCVIVDLIHLAIVVGIICVGVLVLSVKAFLDSRN